MSVVRWTVWKSSGQITYRDLARTLYLSFLSERGTIEDISATWKRICQFLASLPLRISVRNPLCHQSLESYVPRCLHLQELLSKWVGPCRLIFCIWKKPLDQYAFEQTNMTGTDDQLHHWFGASGRLHGHFNVQDCIFYKWSGLFFFTSQPFCCQGLETSSANAWKALMGCHWSHRLFQRKTMHRVFFWVRCTTCNDGRGKLIPKTFDYLTHFDSCLLHQFLHFSPVPLGYHTTVFGPSMSRQ